MAYSIGSRFVVTDRKPWRANGVTGTEERTYVVEVASLTAGGVELVGVEVLSVVSPLPTQPIWTGRGLKISALRSYIDEQVATGTYAAYVADADRDPRD